MTRCPKKKLIWSSNRFGDLSASDFGTPNCAARNFEVVKRTVTQLRKKNKYLNQKCKRLEKKVVTLNDMLDILKKKSLMTDFAADSLKVPIIILVLNFTSLLIFTSWDKLTRFFFVYT